MAFDFQLDDRHNQVSAMRPAARERVLSLLTDIFLYEMCQREAEWLEPILERERAEYAEQEAKYQEAAAIAEKAKAKRQSVLVERDKHREYDRMLATGYFQPADIGLEDKETDTGRLQAEFRQLDAEYQKALAKADGIGRGLDEWQQRIQNGEHHLKQLRAFNAPQPPEWLRDWLGG